MTLLPGKTLGPYEIISALGAGGMGEVYRARDTRLGRDVAIKVVPAHLIGNPEVRARFDREAKAISSLNHPNICTLYDVGRAPGEAGSDGVDFLVMELVEGETLAERIARGPMSAEQVLRVGAEIADALDKAHKQGLVHRDLKPGNVMLTKSGAKLLDFGLARVTGLGPVSDLSQSPTVTRPLTTEGSIVGTFQYMSPEQLDGSEADARADLWGLGLLLYEMATGQKAFSGKSQASLISSIMKDEPKPISELQPLSPPGLDRLVRACLAKDPDERVQTAHDVKLQIRWIAEGGSQAGVPAPVAARRRGRERLAWTLAAACAAIAVAAMVIPLATRVTPAPPVTTRFSLESPAATRGMFWPCISPDGRILAFQAADSSGKIAIWLRPLNSLVANPLPGTEGAGRPFWSPDSRYLAYFSGDQLRKIAVGGGPPQLVGGAKGGADGAWGASNIILFDGSAGDSIRQIPADGGLPTGATTLDRTAGETQHAWPRFLPDGRHFLYVASRAAEGHLKVGTLGSTRSVDLGPIQTRAEYDPAGYVLYGMDGTLMARPFDAKALRWTGEPFPVAERIVVRGSRAEFSVSESGVLAVRSGGSGNARGTLVWLDRTGRELGQEGPPDTYRDFALSPDGTRIAYSRTDEGLDTRDVWVRDLRRGVSSRLTFDTESDEWPTWSPDGRRVAYAVWQNDGTSLVLARQADGSGAPDTIAHLNARVGPEDWTMDGKTIVLTRILGNADVLTVAASGDEEPKVLVEGRFNQRDGRASPDGRWLAYASGETGRSEVYVMPFGAGQGRWLISSGGGFSPYWRADGGELYYQNDDDEWWAVPIDTRAGFSAGAPEKLFRRATVDATANRNRIVPARDGRRFLVNASTGSEQERPSFQMVLDWAAELRKR